MITVTGATGHLGRLVIAALLKKVPASGIVAAVVAAVRNVEKARDLAALDQLREIVTDLSHSKS
jgi:NAD(P)H dehydrogenase (quinone)